MSLVESINVALAVIFSIGGGGVIVFSLANWLGKVWADRLMQRERAEHSENLEQLRAQLKHDSDLQLGEIKNNLEIYKEKHLKGHADKLATYRLVVDVVVELLGELDQMKITGRPPADAAARWDRFNRSRMRAYGYLAMLAPQTVMDTHDALMDHLFEVASGHKDYVWPDVRNLAINLLNEIRRDIDIGPTSIEYRGRH